MREMIFCTIKPGLYNRIVSSFDISNKLTDRRYYYTYWKKYHEIAERTKRIIERRENVKSSTKGMRASEGLLGMKQVSYLLYGSKLTDDFSPINFTRWRYYKGLKASLMKQRFNQKMYHTLGKDLAAATFILNLNGKVKFQNFLNWTETADFNYLPKEYDSSYVVVAIDASCITYLRYEAFDSLLGLNRLKWLSLRGCCYVDDWCLDRISGEYPALEYLDISNCKMITERGLESLYKLRNLKTLCVTNFNDSVAFELTCLLLEDCIPELTCKISLPPSTLKMATQ